MSFQPSAVFKMLSHYTTDTTCHKLRTLFTTPEERPDTTRSTSGPGKNKKRPRRQKPFKCMGARRDSRT